MYKYVLFIAHFITIRCYCFMLCLQKFDDVENTDFSPDVAFGCNQT